MYCWYIIKVQSRLEDSVVRKIRTRLTKIGLIDHLKDVYIPNEEVTVVKGGKKKTVECKLFPGYLMIEIKKDSIALKEISSIPGTYGFLGGLKPIPMKYEEMKELVAAIKKGEIARDLDLTYKVGDNVRICDGPFNSFNGRIQEIDLEKERVKVVVSVFERTTVIELSYSQIEKV